MNTLFILFFTSLLGIIIMITRKLSFVRNAQILGREDVLHPFIPDINKIKHITRRGVKAYGYLLLVTSIRLYVKSLNILKQKFEEVKIKTIDFISKKKNNNTSNSESTQEENNFLKRVSEYKQKIREIKHKVIKEEEKNQ